MNSISISDMQNFVENMGPSDMKMSANIGNVIELGDEDLGNETLTSIKHLCAQLAKIAMSPIPESSKVSEWVPAD